MFTAVIALVAVVSAFVFVTKFYSSGDAYNITELSDDVVDIDDIDLSEEDVESEDGNGELSVDGVEGANTKGVESGGGAGSAAKDSGILGRKLVPMESIVVNLGSVDTRRYLRVIVNLEVDSDETEKKIVENNVIFRDKLVTFLSMKNADEIGTASSQINLRAEIKDILNKELLGVDNAITQVYFSDFIVQ